MDKRSQTGLIWPALGAGASVPRTKMALRIVKWAAIIVVALIVLAVGGVAALFYRAMPNYSGSASLPGLSASVRVYRDAYAVPHIFAANWDDAARALGYIHASERLYEMEIQRRA